MALLNKVFLKNPKLSNFDLSRKWRGDMAPGVLYPVLVEEMLPGDSVDLSIKSLVKTYPLLAPLMGSFKLQFDTFFVPTRLYIQNMQLNSPNFDPQSVSLPTFNTYCTTDANSYEYNSGINEPFFDKQSLSSSHIFSYLGLPTGYSSGGQSQQYNAVPLLGYYDIFRNYYVNTQEDNYLYFGEKTGSSFENPNSSYLHWSSLTDLNFFFDYFASNEVQSIEEYITTCSCTPLPYLYDTFDPAGYYTSSLSTPFNGLVCKTFNSDFNSAWLNTGTYESMITKAKINVEGDSFTVNQLRTGNKLMKYLERSLVSGGRFGDWIQAQFGVNTDYKLDIPEFIGSNSTEIIFDDVVQLTGYDSKSPLGSLGGRGKGYLDSAPHHFRCSENGYLMVIASLTPRPDYYQGIKPYLNKTQYSDLFSPQLDNLGFQSVPRSQLSGLSDYSLIVNESGGTIESVDLVNNGNIDTILTQSVGYQPAWQEYMTALNELHGDFTSSLNYWSLGRTFTDPNPLRAETEAKSYVTLPGSYENSCIPTTYINPAQFNFAFADSSETAANFLVQISFDFFARRPISKQIMPTL